MPETKPPPVKPDVEPQPAKPATEPAPSPFDPEWPADRPLPQPKGFDFSFSPTASMMLDRIYQP